MEILIDKPAAKMRLIWDGRVVVEMNGRRVDSYENTRWHRYADATDQTRRELDRKKPNLPPWALYNFGMANLIMISSSEALANHIWELTAPDRDAAEAEDRRLRERAAKWEATKPAEVDQWRREADAIRDHYEEQQRRFDDESLSSIGIGPAPKHTVELTPEGRAWLEIENSRSASHPMHRIAYDHARDRVIDGEQGLVEAAAQAAREWSDYASSTLD